MTVKRLFACEGRGARPPRRHHRLTLASTRFVSSGYVTPGANASSSSLVDPRTSPLCGTLGGNAPKGYACVTSAQITTIKAWLATGAPNN